MCGIFAYTGSKNAGPLLLGGLVSLEYRGYDSAGIFLPERGSVRTRGAVAELRRKIQENFTQHLSRSQSAKGNVMRNRKGAGFAGRSGIAHLRWATHGEPSERNAHPHADCKEEIYVAHNGIIENYRELKSALKERGHTFRSDTDTEVLAHLIEEHTQYTKKFEHAVLAALNQVRGTYGIVAQCKACPEKIVAARMGSPVVLGVGTRERFIASDPSPIIPHTKKVIFLEDGEAAVITPTSHTVLKLDATKVKRGATKIDWGAEKAKRNGHKHFMLKEILEGPEVLENTLRGRLIVNAGKAKLGGLEAVASELKKIERVIIVACGTAYYAGLIGEYMLEEQAGIPVEVELASEFRYRVPVLNQRTAVIAISQSGETADTLAAVREGKKRGALTLGIVNAVGSTIARETDAGVYNHAGPEMGVASTKALVSQLEALVLFTLFLGRERNMTPKTGREIARELAAIPKKVATVLAQKGQIEKLAKKYAYARDFLFIGRKYNYPVALEGAIKLKEVSYIHAEGYASGEMKHGPIAMIDKKFPTIAVVPSDSVYEKNLSNIHELKARGGPVIAIATEGNEEMAKIADDVVYVPKTIEMLNPILCVIPLQLFAYYFARERGLNPDRPRNLAKSVTVE